MGWRPWCTPSQASSRPILDFLIKPSLITFQSRPCLILFQSKPCLITIQSRPCLILFQSRPCLIPVQCDPYLEFQAASVPSDPSRAPITVMEHPELPATDGVQVPTARVVSAAGSTEDAVPTTTRADKDLLLC